MARRFYFHDWSAVDFNVYSAWSEKLILIDIDGSGAAAQASN